MFFFFVLFALVAYGLGALGGRLFARWEDKQRNKYKYEEERDNREAERDRKASGGG